MIPLIEENKGPFYFLYLILPEIYFVKGTRRDKGGVESHIPLPKLRSAQK